MVYISTALRRSIEERANYRCEYCLLHRDDHYWPYEVDHIYATKHGGETVEANLCFSCPDCNRYKGSDIASLDPLMVNPEPVALFHPRSDDWNTHFRHDNGFIEPLTSQGRTTARLLHLNDADRVLERRLLVELGRYP